MSILRLPYLTKTKTGIYGYRRRDPDCIRATVGKTEIVRSFNTSDLRALRQRHAAFHAVVERTFANAGTGTSNGNRWTLGEIIRPIRARGRPASEPQGKTSVDDLSSAGAIVLTDVGV